MNTRRLKHAVLAGACLTLLSAAVLRLGTVRAAQTAEPLMEQQFKNIQVLKGLPAAQMRPLMNLISASLGMKCDACHVKTGDVMEWDKDDKKNKQTARKMIEMTQALNKTYFEGNLEVSCFTCHNGLGHPAGVPPLMKSVVAAAKPASPQLTAQQVLAKYAAAVGPKEAVEKIKTRVFKGQQLAENGQTADLELSYAGPDKLLSTVKIGQGEMTWAVNGSNGWLKNPREQRALDSAELAKFKSLAASLDPLPLREPYPRVNYGGVEKIGEREAYVLRMMTPDRKRVRLSFDAQTGLLVRRVTTSETLLGLDPEQIDFEDYRDVEGVKVPFTVRVTYLDTFFSATRKFTEIKHNVSVDEAKFTVPK